MKKGLLWGWDYFIIIIIVVLMITLFFWINNKAQENIRMLEEDCEGLYSYNFEYDCCMDCHNLNMFYYKYDRSGFGSNECWCKTDDETKQIW